MDINKITNWYVFLLIIGFSLYLYFSNRKLKKELELEESVRKFTSEILCAYMDKYGEDLQKELIEEFVKKAGITDEHPLKIKVRERRF